MAYEAQIAGVGDDPPGTGAARARAIRLMQALSASELIVRRGRIVNAVRQVADLEFVNGGGTGSIERTVARRPSPRSPPDPGSSTRACSTSTARFTGRPAALFALPVVRRPAPGAVTVLGGGYLASGAAGDRAGCPSRTCPPGCATRRTRARARCRPRCSARPAEDLRIGDRVWFRHAKAGELCERFDALHLVEGDTVVDRPDLPRRPTFL